MAEGAAATWNQLVSAKNMVKHNRLPISALTTRANVFIENTAEEQKP